MLDGSGFVAMERKGTSAAASRRLHFYGNEHVV